MHRILSAPDVAQYEAGLGRETVKGAVEQMLDRVRASGDEPSFETIVAGAAGELERMQQRRLQPAINATGIIVHTNLGRAPLAPEALDAVVRLGRGYSNLEYDLESGDRGSRYARLAGAIGEATGAQDALVVNNGAAAVLLVLDTFAKGREVIVARSQLVEIGGGFRVPEVLERSGATLVEVGTTNRVYIDDFERALSPRTALILRTHPSNYRIEGFTHEADPKELVALGRRAGVLVVEDLGTGALDSLSAYGVESERTVREALDDGIGLVTFSGDKLLGGPQAGIIAGTAQLVARLRTNPLLRALRVDKLTLAALEATLSAAPRRPRADSHLPHVGAQRSTSCARARRSILPRFRGLRSSRAAGISAAARCRVKRLPRSPSRWPPMRMDWPRHCATAILRSYRASKPAACCSTCARLRPARTRS